MKRTCGLFILLHFIVFWAMLSCQREKHSTEYLIQDFDLKGSIVKNIDELFDKQAKYTMLETTIDESLIGKIDKIIKRANSFFILSDGKQINQFDENGKFITALKKLGNGPGEYTMITDFNICINDEDEIEIWLSDFQKIRKYQYIHGFWKETSTINYPYVINKFYIINENKILLLTGQNSKCLTISDGKGKEITSFLKSEIPFMVFKPVQFINFSTGIVYQKGVSNDCVIFEDSSNTFKESEIVKQDDFLTSRQLKDLFLKYEYEYLRELSSLSYIRTIRQTNEQILLESYMDNNRHVSVYTKNAGWKHIIYNPKDIDANSEYSCLSTIGVGDGLTSFIMFKNSDNYNDNPILVEY